MITTEISNGIARLTIDMPGRTMNVLTQEFATALSACFDTLLKDPELKGIIIASGKPSFIAGADLGQMAGFVKPGVTPAMVFQQAGVYSALFRRIETCGKPVVVAACGTALGGGLELMLCGHYRIAADDPKAQFGLPESKLGLLPGAGGTQRLPRLIGIAASIPLIVQGTSMGARDAQKIGLFNEVVPPGELMAAAERAILEGRVKAVAPWDVKGYKLPGGDAHTAANSDALGAANASIHAATGGNYPAPLAILRCIYEGSKLPMDKGLRLEVKHFVTLMQDSVAQNMIRTLFFAKQAADKLARRPADVPKSSVKKLGILGSGFMGAGIAQVSALNGIEVVLLDRDLATAQKGRDGIVAAFDADVQKGRLKPEARDAAVARLVAAEGYAAFKDCDLVIEAVIEDVGVKATVTKAAEAAMRADAIYASNTSALPITDLAAVSVRAQNFIGLHFFSPVAKMAVVEVIVGRDTAPTTLARALDYIRQIRKTPIIVNDGYGFYTSRCVDAYIREGMRLLVDGVKPALIENAGVALGMPVGPLSLGDEVGVDVLHHITHFFQAREKSAWGDDKHKPDHVIDKLTAANKLGRKSGAGFYIYPAGAPKHMAAELATDFPAANAQPAVDAVKERLLYAQLVEAARCWADGVISDAAEADLGAVLAWAFPAYLGGPMAAIDAIGTAPFVARCDQLKASLGARFEVPQAIRDFAARGGRFHPS
jgi:3-hydroxyacyl-CoA dehydrogenase / enoyl-CoA hydratase / 3-hydroxybutyryl-CoA epimerase